MVDCISTITYNVSCFSNGKRGTDETASRRAFAPARFYFLETACVPHILLMRVTIA